MMGVCECCIEYRSLAVVSDRFGAVHICADCRRLRDEVEHERKTTPPTAETRS